MEVSQDYEPAPQSPGYRRDRADERSPTPQKRSPSPADGRARDASPEAVPSRQKGSKDNEGPQPSRYVGVFGLSTRTTERDLKDEMSRFAEVEKVVIVYDQRTGRSRGFAFCTLASTEDGKRCVREMNGLELHGRKLRVDYSATTKPHDPTPGQYMGFKRSGPSSYPPRGGFGGGGRGGGHGGGRYEPYDRHSGRGGGYGGGGGGGGVAAGGTYDRSAIYEEARRRGERRTPSPPRGGRYEDRRGGAYDDRRVYDERHGSSSRNHDDKKYDDRRGYDDKKYDDRERKYDDRERKYDDRDGGRARSRSPARRPRSPDPYYRDEGRRY